MASLPAQTCPLVMLAATAFKLLARAVRSCLASAAAPGEHTVVLELQQSPQAPGLLGLRGGRGRPPPPLSHRLPPWPACDMGRSA